MARLDDEINFLGGRGYLDKERAISYISEQIEFYSMANNLPVFELSKEEWDVFFDCIYDFLVCKKGEKFFYDYMCKIIRFSYIDVMVNGCGVIDYNFLSQSVYSLFKEFSDEELDELIRLLYGERDKLTQKQKIISLEHYRRDES